MTGKVCSQCGAEFGPEQRFCPNDGSALRPVGSDDPLIGQVIADRYQILEVLGEGGMGRVYLAEHVRMGRKSAVKMMSPNLALSADAISRFNREAANASRINQPNVAQIYDFGETSDGMLYLAMEYVEGETLRTIIEREGPMPPQRAAELTKQIADALAAAHHLGIVHRDLKPDNIMVARHHDGRDWVKVVDFGIAKTVQGSGGKGGSQTVTTAGVSLGTPEYMSPEQLAGEKLDAGTDLYSLGLVLFNMLTADLPYPRVTSKETLVRRLTSTPRTLAEVAPLEAWPPQLQAALDRALAPESSDRYSSVVDFGRDVVAASSIHDPEATVRVAPAPRLSGPTQRVPASRGALQAMVEPKKHRRRVLVMAGSLIVVLSLGVGALVAYRARGSGPASTTPTDSAQRVAAAPATASAPVVSQSAVADSSKLVLKDSASSKPTALADSKAQKSAQKSTSPAVVAPLPSSTSASNGGAPPAGPQKPARVVAQQPSPTPAPADSAVSSGGEPRRQHNRQNNFGAHNWLSANGDSGAAHVLPANATNADRIRFMADEIRGHMARARQYLMSADPRKMQTEFSDANREATMLRQLFPSEADSLHVQQMVRGAGLQLKERVCPTALADTTKHFPAGFTCAMVLPGLNGRGRASGDNARRPPVP